MGFLSKVLGAMLLVCSLIFLASATQAAENASDLPARVEGSQFLPPAPVFLAPHSAPAEYTAATLPGEPLRNTGRAVKRGGGAIFRFFFRGRGRGGCG